LTPPAITPTTVRVLPNASPNSPQDPSPSGSTTHKMSPSPAERLSTPAVRAHSDSQVAVKTHQAAILPTIHGPADVQKLTVPEMQHLAAEVRERIIDVIARKGGHFGAPLGAVDLTIALLHSFD